MKKYLVLLTLIIGCCPKPTKMEVVKYRIIDTIIEKPFYYGVSLDTVNVMRSQFNNGSALSIYHTIGEPIIDVSPMYGVVNFHGDSTTALFKNYRGHFYEELRFKMYSLDSIFFRYINRYGHIDTFKLIFFP